MSEYFLFTNGGIEVGGPFTKSEAQRVLHTAEARHYGATHIATVPHRKSPCNYCRPGKFGLFGA